MSPSRRRLATFLLTFGIVFLVAGILSAKLETFEAWRPFFWPLMTLGFLGVLPVFLVWRCPHCRSFPGPVSATHCRQCGKSLDGTEGPLEETVREARPIEPDAERRFIRVVRRLQAIDRFGDRAMYVGLGLGVVSGIAMFAYRHELTLAGMAALVVGLVSFGLMHYGYAITKNGMLILLRCPACRRSLVNNLAEYCPHCGTRLPEWQ